MIPFRSIFLATLFFFARPVSTLVYGPWSATSLPAEKRAELLVANMTLDEKLAMLHGYKHGAYVGNMPGNSRLGIPNITMNDGPQGFRDDAHKGTSTAWPAAINLAASFDRDAVYEWGSGMGREFFDKGSNVQLGPGLCLARVPRNGRNFEYLSGEDPYLGRILAQPAVRGIQSQKVVANAKHWVLNNQETHRSFIDDLADERTRFEMYYPPFEGAIAAGVGSFMCSYNKVNGKWSCENPTTLARDLKETMGFTGYVMSDWGATHSTSIMQGLDVEMPGKDHMSPNKIKEALHASTVTLAAVDESVKRILRPMFAVGVMDEPLSSWYSSKIKNNVTTQASVESARRLAALSTVLLKNDGGLLPLPTDKAIKLALIGFASDNALVHGGGSGEVTPSHLSTPLEGIRAAAGHGSQITFTTGVNIEAAAAAAKAADYAIVFVGALSREGFDRASLSLDTGCAQVACHQQNALVSKIARANPKTIVVMSVPGAILLPWSPDVPAILTNFMPGQQAGNSIADVLFGTVNPSAKLPLTFPNKENEIEFSPEQWPGTPESFPAHANYTEKLLVGYRFYDAEGIKFSSGFPFGHGLSYTEFKYGDLATLVHANGVSVNFSVTNVGKRPGAEVSQLYLGFPAAVGEPPWQLKGFQKTRVLAEGEKETVAMTLPLRDLSIWDIRARAWSPAKGSFALRVGSSSRDIRLHTSFTFGADSRPSMVAIVV